MTTFDAVIAVVLGLSLIYSVFRGMILEIFSLMAYAGGYLMALKFRGGVADIMLEVIDNKTAANIISFAVIFFATSIIITLIGKAVRSLIHSAPTLSWVDRLIGGAIGILKAAVILVVLMYPLKFFPDFNKKITKDSFFAPHLKKVSNQMSQAIGSPTLFDRLPKISLDGMEDQLKMMKDLPGKLESLKKILPEKNGKPQDEYTEDEKKQLDDILKSINK